MFFFGITVSSYSCVCSDEGGGAHDAADHDNDLCKVIYSFVCESQGEFQAPYLPHDLNNSSRSAAGPVIHSLPVFDYKLKD